MEYIDIYDENRHRIGNPVPRKGAFMQKGQYMLYVLALLEDREGRFLITRRALDKKWAAGSWEVPGGGAQAGEDAFTAVTREVREETGLVLTEHGLMEIDRKPIYSYANVDEARGDNYFVDIFHFHLDFTEKDITIEEEESIDGRLASIGEIADIHKAQGFLHYERILEALAAEE